MKASDLISALCKVLDASTQNALAERLGISVQTLLNWKKQDGELTPSQVANLLAKSRLSAVWVSQYETIRPLVEYFKVRRVRTKQDASWQIMSGDGDATTYAKGLKAALDKAHGVYVFYDSRGQALYVGKALEQSLWKEMNLAFNRPREVQKIKLAAHPSRNQEFKPAHEKLRQPRDTQLELYDMASYFSAYSVDPGMIDDVEALMVRAFANSLLNVRMETFVHSRE